MIKKEVNNEENLILRIGEDNIIITNNNDFAIAVYDMYKSIKDEIKELKESIDDIRSRTETEINDMGNEIDDMICDISELQEEVNKLKEDFQNRNNSDTLFNTKINKAIDVILKVLKINPNEWEYKCEVVKKGGNDEK